jgi:hypothetical protein
MLTFQNILPDIRDLIFDQLSIPDLISLYHASLPSPSLRQSCKRVGTRRLTHIITTSAFKIRAIIDGERGLYKRYRNDRYEREDDAFVTPRPFRPFDSFETNLQRTFPVNSTGPQMVATEQCIRKETDLMTKYIYNSQYSGGDPQEIVTVIALFLIRDMPTPTRLAIEYDTADCSISGVQDEDDGDGGYLRTVSHPLRFKNGLWGIERNGRRPMIGFSLTLPRRDDYEVPKEWLEMLGNQVMAKVVFKKQRSERPLDGQPPQETKFIMQFFEVVWDVELSESSFRPDVLDLWRDGE